MRKNFKYISFDGETEINAYVWECDRKPKAILQCSHGMMEDSLSFNELAEFLNSKDIIVCSHDIIGHGKSVIDSSTFGRISNKDSHVCPLQDMKNLHDIISKEYTDIPYFMLGFSLSSFTLRRYIQIYNNDLAGAIIMGTGDELRANVTATKVIQNVYGKLKDKEYDYLANNPKDKDAVEQYKANNPDNLSWFQINDKSKDKFIKTELWKYIYTIDSYYSFRKQFKIIDNNLEIDSIPKDLPIVFLSGKNDILGQYGSVTTEIYNNYKNAGIKDIKLKLYPGLFHPILQSKEKDKVMSDIFEWINNRIN